MTEAEWRSWENPGGMLRHLGRRTSQRKLRLAIIELYLPTYQFHASNAEQPEWPTVAKALPSLHSWADSNQSITDVGRRDPAWWFLRMLEQVVATQGGFKRLYSSAEWICATRLVDRKHYRIGSRRIGRLLSEIFGNPFRPVALASEWRSDTAVSLAKHIYEARDFAQMPILADALQDAGCDNADVLNHCRDTSQTHVRGCWVVDLVLGKT